MGDLGSYIWFIGLGGGIAILAIAMLYGRGRKRAAGVGDLNAAWERDAADTGHPEVAGRERR